jgi:hypothetical protein
METESGHKPPATPLILFEIISLAVLARFFLAASGKQTFVLGIDRSDCHDRCYLLFDV